MVGKKWIYWIHVCIGLGFMLFFPMLDPIEPISEVGMTVVGVFLGMIYLFSTVGSIWPTLVGLLLIAFSGYLGENYQGYAAVKQVFLEAIGSETTLVCLLGLVLFGALQYVGCTEYIAQFFLTRKFTEGRPYLFMFVFCLCPYLLSAMTTPPPILLLMFPITVSILERCGYKVGDKLFYSFICGVYLATTLGQPMLPFKGAEYVVVSAFQNSTGLEVNYGSYILYNIIMSIILLLVYFTFIRFVIRPDVSGLRELKVKDIQMKKLPPMNLQQKTYFIMIVIFVVALLLPQFLPASAPGIGLLKRLGTLGVTVTAVAVLMIVRFEGKPMLDFPTLAKQGFFSWDVIFLVAGALYVCTALSNSELGIKAFLVQALNPVLGGRPMLMFIFLVLAFAITTTNFANNAGMAVVILPVIISFSELYPEINLTALSMTVCMIVFVALLTPAASPPCAILHAHRHLVSLKEIYKLFIPMFFIALLLYMFIGYPIATLLFH